MTHDPLGPGTPAWEAADRAIASRESGNQSGYETARDEMIRHLVAANASNATIREWETFILTASSAI